MCERCNGGAMRSAQIRANRDRLERERWIFSATMGNGKTITGDTFGDIGAKLMDKGYNMAQVRPYYGAGTDVFKVPHPEKKDAVLRRLPKVRDAD